MVSFHLNKGTNQTKYHWNVDCLVCRRHKEKDTESINYAYSAFHSLDWACTKRGREREEERASEDVCELKPNEEETTIKTNLHNQVSVTVSFFRLRATPNESRLGIICLSKFFVVSNQFHSHYFLFFIRWRSIALFRIIVMILRCVWSRHENFIPLFMTPLFCRRDFFHPFLYEDCERIFFIDDTVANHCVDALKRYTISLYQTFNGSTDFFLPSHITGCLTFPRKENN